MQPLLSNSAFSITPWFSVLANQHLDILDAQAPSPEDFDSDF